LPALLVHFWRRWRLAAESLAGIMVGAVLAWLVVWQLHFSLARRVNPALEDHGYFYASDTYRRILRGERPLSPAALPLMFADALSFVHRYEKGVPKLNLCKSDETGSPSFLWPLGGRAINYRWETAAAEGHRYLYLQANPAVWLAGLAGLLLACALLAASVFYPKGAALKQRGQLVAFLCLYGGYMCIMARLERVMYLYHYFIPLLISFILLALVAAEIDQIGPLRFTPARKRLAAFFGLLLVIAVYRFYAPLTYYQAIRPEDVKRRALAGIWDLTCVGCPRTNQFALPLPGTEIRYVDAARLKLGELEPFSAAQAWGEPQFGQSVDNKTVAVGGAVYERVFGVHAKSSLRYRLGKEYSRLEIGAALPDYLDGKGSVEFEIYGDGKPLWKSARMRSEEPVAKTSVPMLGVEVLELRVDDGGDGMDFDHACWLEPRLVKGE
jgi:hypothetical protein